MMPRAASTRHAEELEAMWDIISEERPPPRAPVVRRLSEERGLLSEERPAVLEAVFGKEAAGVEGMQSYASMKGPDYRPELESNV